MSYKDLLVHVDDSRRCDARLELAAALAKRFDAHLAGLAVDPGIVMPIMADAAVSPELLETLEADRAARIEAAQSAFDSAMQAAGLEAEWRTEIGEPVSRIALHARHSDLVVVGQDDSEGGLDVVGGLADALVMTCGRPVLIVPYIGAPETLAKRVMVAWDGGREAVRAINDALPLLIGADLVEVVSVNPEKRGSDHGEIPGADMCLHLARHGVKAEAQHIAASDVDVGNMLLSRLADVGADLLVMGAYGHSRWREIVLGGATQQVLSEMTVPVVMSH